MVHCTLKYLEIKVSMGDFLNLLSALSFYVHFNLQPELVACITVIKKK